MWMGSAGKDKVTLFMAFQFKSALIVLAFVTLGWTSFCSAQPPQPTTVPSPQHSPKISSDSERLPGSVSGTVVDQSGAVVTGAHVRLTGTGENQSLMQEVLSDDDGQFVFTNIAPGSFQLTITAAGFATQTSSGILHSGEFHVVPQIALAIATNMADMEVSLSQTEVAEEQIQIEEKQRVLGVLPNFYVSYIPNAVPLTAKQKYKLAWKTLIDPFTVVSVAGAAGIEQAQNHFAEYGQGAQGYAKRFGAGYGDTAAGTFIGGAILPSLLKQDPRYFYKGTGSIASRFLYAIANAVICKGDNRRWQPNYSNILGNMAAGGVSNLYYPKQDRNGAGLTFENAAIGIGASAIANLFQEFVVKKLTPKARTSASAKP